MTHILNTEDLMAWIEIDLDKVAHNVQEICSKIGPKVTLMATVKADAYGHGAYEIASTALQHGAKKLGVSSLYEGIALRQKGIQAPILILALSLPRHAETIVRHDLMQTVSDDRLPRALSQAAQNQNKQVYVNVKVNTGMNRIGIEPESAVSYVKELLALPNLKIEGIFTHFATSYMEREFTEIQFARFQKALKALSDAGIDIPYKHCCNTGGLINFPHTYLNQVRPGATLTTKYPEISPPEEFDIVDVMQLKSKIISMRDVAAGEGIGYNLMYQASQDMKIAIVPIGWGDGFPRELTNKGTVLIRGEICPVVGRVCCDQVLVDISHVTDPHLEDEVVLIGQQGKKEIKASQWAKLVIEGVSSHLTQRTLLTSRLPRLYFSDGEQVAQKRPLNLSESIIEGKER